MNEFWKWMALFAMGASLYTIWLFLPPPAMAGEKASSVPVSSQALSGFGSDPSVSLAKLGWQGGNGASVLGKDGKPDHFLQREGKTVFLKSRYFLGKNANYFYKEVDWDTTALPVLRWRWRVQKFPKGALILNDRKSDAPAQIYIVWKEFIRHFVIKYFWASAERVGLEFKQTNLIGGELFGKILRSGGLRNQWHTEMRDVEADFEAAFKRKPPGKVHAIAVLSDGDDTQTESEADYADFTALPSQASATKKAKRAAHP